MSTTLTYREALQAALAEELARDERVVLLGEDAGSFGGVHGVTAGLAERFGSDRVRDTAGAEQALAGLAAGAALTGLRPVVELAGGEGLPGVLGALLAAAALGAGAPLPLVVRVAQGHPGRPGPGVPPAVEAFALQLPGVTVAAPSTPADAKGLLKAAIRSDEPVIFIEHQALYDARGEVDDDEELVAPLGVAELRRGGRDITLAGSSRAAASCLEAADLLEREHGIAAEVLDLRSLRPLDLDAIVGSVQRTNRLLVADEGWPAGGVGATVAALAGEHAFDHLDAPVLRVGAADVPVPYAAPLAAAAVPGARAIADAAAAALGAA